jgi:hypothetical protein
MIPEVRACSIPAPHHPALPHQSDIPRERRGPASPPEGPIEGGVEGPIKGGIKGPLKELIPGGLGASGIDPEWSAGWPELADWIIGSCDATVTAVGAMSGPRPWPAHPGTASISDRATTPEAFSVASEIVTGTGRWGQLDPRADGQPGWLDGERKQRPPTYQETRATLPALPGNRRTPPAAVATEGVAPPRHLATERAPTGRQPLHRLGGCARCSAGLSAAVTAGRATARA